MKKIITVLSFTVLAGCAQKSPIEKVSESTSHFADAFYEGSKDFYITEDPKDGEQYRIFHQASTGFTLTSVLRKSATKRANQFCSDMEKGTQMYTMSEHTASPPYLLGNFPRIEIIFVCSQKELVSGGAINVSNKYEDLLKIKELHDTGILTNKEYQAEKQKLLAQ
ncbi:SHOCT domain-containing protein [Vibrio gigantis]|uniref:SHOCT domain-containing protein n=1 Tax=Vibrio gigantis TaxID=296199 RepID=UPI003D0D603C